MKQKKVAPVARHIVPRIFGTWIGKVTGKENLPKKGGFIIAPNHCSYLEHFLIGSIIIPFLNRKIHILAKKEHYDDMGQKTWHKYWQQWVKQIPIDRSKGEDALKEAETCLREGGILVLYPEGTRSLTGKLGKGKTGAARLALWAKVPIVPLGIKGTFDILPKGKKVPSLKKADFHFGKPLYFKEYYNTKVTKEALDSITTNLMEQIAQLSGQTYKK